MARIGPIWRFRSAASATSASLNIISMAKRGPGRGASSPEPTGGSLEQADDVLCEGCGCLMQVIAIEGGHEPADVIDLAAHRTRRADASGRLAA